MLDISLIALLLTRNGCLKFLRENLREGQHRSDSFALGVGFVKSAFRNVNQMFHSIKFMLLNKGSLFHRKENKQLGNFLELMHSCVPCSAIEVLLSQGLMEKSHTLFFETLAFNCAAQDFG